MFPCNRGESEDTKVGLPLLIGLGSLMGDSPQQLLALMERKNGSTRSTRTQVSSTNDVLTKGRFTAWNFQSLHFLPISLMINW
jgi:hypothetical protein